MIKLIFSCVQKNYLSSVFYVNVYEKSHISGCIMKAMRIFWEKYIYWCDWYKWLKIFKIVSSCINTLAETILPRLECSLELLGWNASQEPCNVSLDVLHRLPVLSLQLSLQSGEQKKITRSQVRAVRRLGHHGGLALGQVVGNVEGRVAGGIVVVELEDVFDVKTDARNLAFRVSVQADKFRVSAIAWIFDRRSELKTSRTRWTFSSVRAVIGRPKWFSSVTSTRPFLKALCHLLHWDFKMHSTLKASWSIW